MLFLPQPLLLPIPLPFCEVTRENMDTCAGASARVPALRVCSWRRRKTNRRPHKRQNEKTRVRKPFFLCDAKPEEWSKRCFACFERNPSKQKIGYWAWIITILYLEYKIIRKYKAVDGFIIANEFLWRTYLGSLTVHLIIDSFTLLCLNCLHPALGVTHPPHLRGKPVLRWSEENAVLLRHVLKSIVRIAPVNSMLLGAAPNHYHGYTLKQALLIVGSPTVFGVLLAIKVRGGGLVGCLVRWLVDRTQRLTHENSRRGDPPELSRSVPLIAEVFFDFFDFFPRIFWPRKRV